MSGTGGGTNTVSTSSQPPANFESALSGTLGQVGATGATPLSLYPAGTNASNLVAPLNQTQNTAFNEIGATQGIAQPYINQAENALTEATTPLYNTVQNYESPYTQSVVNSTEAEYNNQNAQQQQGVVGNAISAGAWGGDRAAVAQGITAGQQELAEAPAIANLENTGYQTGLNADEAQSWLSSQAAAGYGNLGTEALNTNLTGASAELQAGGLEQQESQNILNVPYEQFEQTQAYPFQTAGWTTSELEGLASTAGGTGTSTGTSSPSALSTIAGIGEGGLGIAGLTGGLGANGYLTSLFGGGSAAADTASAVGATGINAAVDAAGAATGAEAGSGLLSLFGLLKRGGAVPARDDGGAVPAISPADLSSTLIDLDKLGSTWKRGGGIAHLDTGGAAVPGAGPEPLTQGIGAAPTPASGIVPKLNISLIPQVTPHRGIGPPRADQGLAHQQGNNSGGMNLSQILSRGINGTNSTMRRGGGIARFDEGGDVPTDIIPPPGAGIAPPSAADTATDVGATGVEGAASGTRGIASSIDPSYLPDYTPRQPNTARVAEMRSQAPYLALLAAGAGTLGGGSTSGVANIGRGAMEGLQTYLGIGHQADTLEEKAGEQADTGAYRKAELTAQARRMSDAADEARKKLAQTDTAQTQLAKYQTGELGLHAQSLADERAFHAAQLANEAIPPDVKTAKWLANATPEQVKAYQQAAGIKAGLPMGLLSPAPAVPGTPGTDSTTGGSAAPSASGSTHNEQFLASLPQNIQGTVKGMVDGRIMPPTSFAMSKPYWQNMLNLAQQYDPTFDQTTWSGRVATRRDFSAGQSAKNITAINTLMGHTDVLDKSFDALGNGDYPRVNWAMNWLSEATGHPEVTNTREAIAAVASEARKVFATTGGGGLTELEDWKTNFPINGSPAQQHGAMKELVSLVDSRIQAMGDQYNRGMGKADDAINLLSPTARSAYQRLTGRDSDVTVGGPPRSPGTGPLPLPASKADLVTNKVYSTGRGPATWNGTAFVPVQ